MKQYLRLMTMGAFALSAQAFAQEWSITPELYSRGGVTYKSDFSKEMGPGDQYQKFNLGPYNNEGLIDYPLTEGTLHAAYGDAFKFHYGFDVNGNRQFLYKDDQAANNKTYLAERVAYGEFKVGGGVSLWYGNRPFRSPPEFLSRSFFFDEKNIMGGGVRAENLGPLNIDLAFGSKVSEYSPANDVNVQEIDRILINKIEVPLSNGMVKTNFEYHRTKKNSSNGIGETSVTGLVLGVAYQRWGDQLFGGNLYNQFVVHTSKGYIGNGALSSAFQPGNDNKYNDDYQPSKLLIGWNGDWKAKSFGVYWLGLYQSHKGEAPNYSKDDMTWNFVDGMIRPVYALTPNVTVGAELDRRSILKEGKGLRDGVINDTDDWATNGGATRWGGLISYNLENKIFDYPTIGIYAGEIIKDRATSFYSSESARRSTHFVRFYYEVKIN